VGLVSHPVFAAVCVNVLPAL